MHGARVEFGDQSEKLQPSSIGLRFWIKSLESAKTYLPLERFLPEDIHLHREQYPDVG